VTVTDIELNEFGESFAIATEFSLLCYHHLSPTLSIIKSLTQMKKVMIAVLRNNCMIT